MNLPPTKTVSRRNRSFFLRAGSILIILATIPLVGCKKTGGGSLGSSPGGYPAGPTKDFPFDSSGNYVVSVATGDGNSSAFNASPKVVPQPRSRPKPSSTPAYVHTRSNPRSTPVTAPKPNISSRPPAPKPTYTPPKPKPKPKATPKPKPKPKPTRRHVVRKGDTLYSLSKRYATTVSAIQKRNGMKGTTIRDGASLIIP